MKPRFLIAVVVAASAGHSLTASAQEFVLDERVREGLGVKAGDFELHPGLEGQAGYDSNYFLRSGTENATTHEAVVSAYRLKISPSISFKTLGARAAEEGGGPPPSATLAGYADLAYKVLFATDSQYSSQVSKLNSLSADVGLRSDLLPDRPVGADVYTDFSRITEASNEIDAANAFRRDVIQAGAALNFRPGGGLFHARAGYQLIGTFFEEDKFKPINNLYHGVLLSTAWRFLPRTAFIYRGAWHYIAYTNTTPATLADGTNVSSKIGLSGLFSNHFGALALFGWAATFYQPKVGPPQNYDGPVAHAEVTWYPSKQQSLPDDEHPVGLSSVSVGYMRDYGNSYLGSYYSRDRAYVTSTSFFGSHFVLSLNGSVAGVRRPPTVFDTGQPQYGGGTDMRVASLAFLEYRPGPMVGVNLTFRYDADLTDHRIPVDPAGLTVDDLRFERYQIYLGVRWFL